MKRGNLIPLWNTLQELSKIRGSVKFAYGVNKNIELIKSEIIAIEKAESSLKDYGKDIKEAQEKFCIKDESGKPVLSEIDLNGRKQKAYTGLDGNEEFKKEIERINSEYKPKIEEIEKFKDEEVSVQFHKIDINCFPDFISAGELHILGDIVEGNPDSKIIKFNK